MPSKKNRIIILIALIISGIILYIGWKELWFLTDDAFITFRYVSNSILGNGYTWNAAPFRPVEGYTSFLWVIILEYVWRIFNVLPPKSSNVLSLILSYGTVLLAAFAILRMRLSKQLSNIRIPLLLLVLLGVLTNRVFLTWSSSGLETALFNFCFGLWVVVAIFSKNRGRVWLFGLTFAAALTYLSRPDGLLVWLATLFLALLSLIGEIRSKRLDYRWFLSALPLMIPAIHIAWRLSYYGEWMPNTYYAKYISAWPEAGIRYFASFCLENGIWIWCLLLVIALAAGIRRHGRGLIRNLPGRLAMGTSSPSLAVCTFVAVGTVIFQVAYYTFIVGGDHFEWRVYSHLVPFLFISFIFLLNSVNAKPKPAIIAILMLIFFSYPIAWTHYKITKRVTFLPIADTLKEPVSDDLPIFLRWLSQPNDALQDWLIDHHICVRRQEHWLFCEYQLQRYPDRTLEIPESAGKYPVAYFTTVGIPSWVLPRVSIIDGYGLNDYVIARNTAASQEGKLRRMAHDRYPPKGYVESFMPNVLPTGTGKFQYIRRPANLELSEKRIRQLEKYWEDKIIHGINNSGQ